MNTNTLSSEAAALLRRRARWLFVGRTQEWCGAARQFCKQDLGAMQRWRVQTGHVAVVTEQQFAQASRHALALAPAELTVACEPGLMQALDIALNQELPQHLAPPTGRSLRMSEQRPPFEGLLYDLLMPEPLLWHLWLHQQGQSWQELAVAHLQSLPGTHPPDASDFTADAVQAAVAALEAWEEELAPVFDAEDREAFNADTPELADQPLPEGEERSAQLLGNLPEVGQVAPEPPRLGLMSAAGEATPLAPPAWRGQLADAELKGLGYAIELRGAEVSARLDAAKLARRHLPEVGSAVALTLHPASGLAIVLHGTWQQLPDGAGVVRPVAEFLRPLKPAQLQALRGAAAALRIAVTM